MKNVLNYQDSDFDASSNISFAFLLRARSCCGPETIILCLEPIDFDYGKYHKCVTSTRLLWLVDEVVALVHVLIDHCKLQVSLPSTVVRWRQGGHKIHAAGKDLTGENLSTENLTRQG